MFHKIRRTFGARYRPDDAVAPVVDDAVASSLSRAAVLLPFIAYLYNLVRDDAGMVRLLDRAVKERYAGGC